MLKVLKPIATFATLLAVAPSAFAQDRPQIATVNYALQYFADRLLGGDADVIFPVPQDADPSFWRPGVSDISVMQSADLILLNGAGFATWVDRVSLPRSRLVNTSAAIREEYIVTESVTHSHGDGGEHSHEGLASYTWLDPTLAIAQAEAVAGAIASRELAPASDVYARFAELRKDLQELDARAMDIFADAGDVAMIATHPRYQYLARRYDLSIASLEWEAGAAPGPEGLDALSALVEQTGATVLIWEAAPPAEAFAQTEALGLVNITVPTLAHRPDNGAFLEAFNGTLDAFNAMLNGQKSN